jgi:hypothetical protein
VAVEGMKIVEWRSVALVAQNGNSHRRHSTHFIPLFPSESFKPHTAFPPRRYLRDRVPGSGGTGAPPASHVLVASRDVRKDPGPPTCVSSLLIWSTGYTACPNYCSIASPGVVKRLDRRMCGTLCDMDPRACSEYDAFLFPIYLGHHTDFVDLDQFYLPVLGPPTSV